MRVVDADPPLVVRAHFLLHPQLFCGIHGIPDGAVFNIGHWIDLGHRAIRSCCKIPTGFLVRPLFQTVGDHLVVSRPKNRELLSPVSCLLSRHYANPHRTRTACSSRLKMRPSMAMPMTAMSSISASRRSSCCALATWLSS